MPTSVETALRKLSSQAAMLSWMMQLTESYGEPLGQGAAEGISDVCDDLANLADRISDTLDAEALSLELVACEDDQADGDDEDAEPAPTRKAKGSK